jgi:uncharacterized protein
MLTGRLSRRRFLQAMTAAALAPAIAPGVQTLAAGATTSVERVTVPFGIPLRVVELADIHIGSAMPISRLATYIEQVIQAQPDLFLLPGDFLSHSMDGFAACAAEIGRVRTPYGTYATLGNHDHWYGDLAVMRRTFEAAGITLLQNAHRVVQTPKGAFVLAGVDDLVTGVPDLAAALRDRPAELPTVLMSHRPEILPAARRAEVALTVAGHYHGGQIALGAFGVRLSVATLETPYPEGLYRNGPSFLYVTRGIGTSLLPFRWNAPPEVSVLDLA